MRTVYLSSRHNSQLRCRARLNSSSLGCAIGAYAVGDEHVQDRAGGATDSAVFDYWTDRKPLDWQENSSFYVLRVHRLEHLQPDDLRERKRKFRDNRRSDRNLEDPWPHVGSHPHSVRRL